MPRPLDRRASLLAPLLALGAVRCARPAVRPAAPPPAPSMFRYPCAPDDDGGDCMPPSLCRVTVRTTTNRGHTASDAVRVLGFDHDQRLRAELRFARCSGYVCDVSIATHDYDRAGRLVGGARDVATESHYNDGAFFPTSRVRTRAFFRYDTRGRLHIAELWGWHWRFWRDPLIDFVQRTHYAYDDDAGVLETSHEAVVLSPRSPLEDEHWPLERLRLTDARVTHVDAFDHDGRIRDETDYAYDAAGRVTEQRRQHCTRDGGCDDRGYTRYAYDVAGHLTGLTLLDRDQRSQQASHVDIEYSPGGDVERWRWSDEGGTTWTREFRYGPDHRLLEVSSGDSRDTYAYSTNCGASPIEDPMRRELRDYAAPAFPPVPDLPR